MNMPKFLTSRKGQLSADNVVNKFVGITVAFLVVAALIGTVLGAVTQLSTSGIALAAVFSAVVPILIAVFVLKGALRMTK